jgi:hypothetical protein
MMEGRMKLLNEELERINLELEGLNRELGLYVRGDMMGKTWRGEERERMKKHDKWNSERKRGRKTG